MLEWDDPAKTVPEYSGEDNRPNCAESSSSLSLMLHQISYALVKQLYGTRNTVLSSVLIFIINI